ncbi:ester cyclase [Pradoshia sp. D12]|nr:ester cyclase [Pradoshia sp. D12]TPF71449.1 ester cyclase [Bacillus sp. D12]
MEVFTLRSVDKKEIVKVWFRDVFTDGNTDILKDIASADMVTHSQGNDEGYVGIEHFKNWLSWYCTSFVERKWSVHDTIEEGDKVVARYSGYSIYKGGLLDIPSENQQVKETGIIIFRIENGKIAEQWCEMSDLQLIQQLGVKFATN